MTARVAAALACAVLAGAAALAQQRAPAPGSAAPKEAPPTALALYEKALGEGDFFTGDTLTVEDAAASFERRVTHADARETARIAAWRGVHQEGGVATVLYDITAEDAVFTDQRRIEAESKCLHLVDQRWYCRVKIDEVKIDLSFYVEQSPGAGEVAEAETGGRKSAAPRLTLPPP